MKKKFFGPGCVCGLAVALLLLAPLSSFAQEFTRGKILLAETGFYNYGVKKSGKAELKTQGAGFRQEAYFFTDTKPGRRNLGGYVDLTVDYIISASGNEYVNNKPNLIPGAAFYDFQFGLGFRFPVVNRVDIVAGLGINISYCDYESSVAKAKYGEYIKGSDMSFGPGGALSAKVHVTKLLTVDAGLAWNVDVYTLKSGKCLDYNIRPFAGIGFNIGNSGAGVSAGGESGGNT